VSDILIGVGICLLMAVMAYMGMYVTLHTPTTDEEKTRWKLGFAALAVVSCLLVGWQIHRSTVSQNQLQDRLNNIRNPPTAEENAAAFFALENKARNTVPPPAENPKPPLSAPTPKQNVKKNPAPSPTPTPETSTAAPPAAQLFVTQSNDTSSRPGTILTRVVIQTTQVFPTLRLALKCDGPLLDGNGGTNGMMMMVNEGVAAGHPNVFILTYQSATPAFGPASPITISLWSKDPVSCKEASTF
jgi:hypothetical protein